MNLSQPLPSIISLVDLILENSKKWNVAVQESKAIKKKRKSTLNRISTNIIIKIFTITMLMKIKPYKINSIAQKNRLKI